ncbi:MAG: hypothetical protein WBA07_10225 [Rivularia sp. (in: cyanobacteria)]
MITASPTIGAVGFGSKLPFSVKLNLPLAPVNLPAPPVIFIEPLPDTVKV